MLGMFDGLIKAAAVIMLIIGALECFAGFKIMKAMMAVWGFLFGAAIGIAVGVTEQSVELSIVFSLMFGITIAILAYKLYLLGIFVLISTMSGFALYLITESIASGIAIGIIAGTAAVFFVKPVVIFSTAVSGASIIISSVYTLMGIGVDSGKAAMIVLWIMSSLAGIVCQYKTTSKINAPMGLRLFTDKSSDIMTLSERRYAGMQKAYRNFCIKCGCRLSGGGNKCPRCGFEIDDI